MLADDFKTTLGYVFHSTLEKTLWFRNSIKFEAFCVAVSTFFFFFEELFCSFHCHSD